jgi:hypothetical protein
MGAAKKRGLRVEDFFPPNPDGQRVILPHQRELLESTERNVAFVGGYGSGKTMAAAVLMLMLLLAVPANIGVICRRSYSKLHDSTLRIFLECLERADIEHEYRDSFRGFHHNIVFQNGSEAWVKETKDLGRWLGPEFGVAWVDEASEEPFKTFEGLTSRLRLPQAKDYLKLILTTNPPFGTHWIPKVFGAQPGSTTKTVLVDGVSHLSTYRLIRSSSKDNPNLPSDYVANLIQTHGEANARRIVDGEFGFTPEGLPVFGDAFAHAKHVGEPKFLVGLQLDRAWDWGFRVPVCTWHQVYKCKSGSVHHTVLQELVGENVESEAFADQVLALTRREFPDAGYGVQDVADAAGAQHNERGPGPIIRLSRPPYSLRFKYRKTMNIDPSLDLMRKQLRAPLCRCGWPVVLIHRQCRNVIDALAGGYHYPEKADGAAALKPSKDGYFDNVADSVRYEYLLRVAEELRPGGPLTALRDAPDVHTFDGYAQALGRDPWGGEPVADAVEFLSGVVPPPLPGEWWRDA